MYMHANKHTCLHHAHSQFGSIQVHPLLLAPCQSFHKLRQMQNKLSMQPVHSPLHQLHLLLHWAQHQMKIMKNWEMWWSKCVVQATMRKLWGSHHTKASARSSKQRIANWGKTGTRCSNNARIGKQNASVLQIQQCMARAPPKRTTKAPSTTKGPSRGTRSKLLLRESTSLQAQSPCNQKWQLVNHPIVSSNCSKMPRGGTSKGSTAEQEHQQRIHQSLLHHQSPLQVTKSTCWGGLHSHIIDLVFSLAKENGWGGGGDVEEKMMNLGHWICNVCCD